MLVGVARAQVACLRYQRRSPAPRQTLRSNDKLWHTVASGRDGNSLGAKYANQSHRGNSVWPVGMQSGRPECRRGFKRTSRSVVSD